MSQCHSIIEDAINRIQSQYVRGCLIWADYHRPELSKKERLLMDTITKLCINNANILAIKAVATQWENTMLEIYAECNKFIANGYK